MTSAARPIAPHVSKPIFDWLFIVAVLSVVGVYIRAIYFTPFDSLQGAAQKIYYLHPPIAVAAYRSCISGFVTNVRIAWPKRAPKSASSSSRWF
jgi:hypothetical protein